MLKLTSIKSDLKAERDGAWVPYPEWPGVSFKVRSIEAPDFMLARDALLRRLTKKYKGDPIPPDDLTTEIGTLYAKHILLDWSGIDEPYSPERALEVFKDPAYRQVTKAIEDCSTKVGKSDAEFLEESVKN